MTPGCPGYLKHPETVERRLCPATALAKLRDLPDTRVAYESNTAAAMLAEWALAAWADAGEDMR